MSAPDAKRRPTEKSSAAPSITAAKRGQVKSTPASAVLAGGLIVPDGIAHALAGLEERIAVLEQTVACPWACGRDACPWRCEP